MLILSGLARPSAITFWGETVVLAARPMMHTSLQPPFWEWRDESAGMRLPAASVARMTPSSEPAAGTHTPVQLLQSPLLALHMQGAGDSGKVPDGSCVTSARQAAVNSRFMPILGRRFMLSSTWTRMLSSYCAQACCHKQSMCCHCARS